MMEASISPSCAHSPAGDGTTESRQGSCFPQSWENMEKQPSLTREGFQHLQDVLLQNSSTADHVWFLRQVLAGDAPRSRV